MAVVAGIPSNNNPVSGVPMPLLLIGVGGGLGLIVFLMRKRGTGSTTEGGTLLPNTAIMLGSLQQSLLDLQGQVGQGNADLGDQITGVGSNLGAQIDAQTGQIQQGFLDLQGHLVDIGNANTQTILDAFKAQGDTLAALIGSNKAAQDAYNAEFSKSVASGFDSLVASQNAELAGLQALQGLVGRLPGQIQNGVAANAPGPWSAYEGKIIAQGTASGRTDPTNTLTYFVQNGKLWGITSADAFLRLTGMSAAEYAKPGASERYVTKIGTPDTSLRAGMAGYVNGGGSMVPNPVYTAN